MNAAALARMRPLKRKKKGSTLEEPRQMHPHHHHHTLLSRAIEFPTVWGVEGRGLCTSRVTQNGSQGCELPPAHTGTSDSNPRAATTLKLH